MTRLAFMGRPAWLAALLLMLMPVAAHASGPESRYWSLNADLDVADTDHGGSFTWEANGWYGGDFERLWLKTEGAHADGNAREADVQLLYGKLVSKFWDVQAGIRQEVGGPTHGVLALQGTAPYFIETELSLFVADDGNLSLRTQFGTRLLITQRAALEPYAELNWHLTEDTADQRGRGLGEIDLGIKLSREIVREVAPYVDFNYASPVGDTRRLMKAAGEEGDGFVIRFGVRVAL